MITTLIILTILSYLLSLFLWVVAKDVMKEMHISMKILSFIPCGVFIVIVGMLVIMTSFKK